MKKLLKISALALVGLPVLLSSCGNSGSGQLVGVQNRIQWFQPDPYGMLYLPMGSYKHGS